MQGKTPWRTEELGTVLIGIDAGWSPECIEQPPSTGQWGILKVSAVTGGRFKPEEAKTLPPSLSPREEIVVKRGDVVMARANGVAALVGAAVQVRDEPERLMLSDKLLRLNPNPELLTRDYLASLLLSSAVREQLDRVLSGSSGQRNISQQQVRGLRVHLPPLAEQRCIAEILDTIDEAIRRTEQIIAKLKQVTRGVLQDLLTCGIDNNGELRDPIRHPEQFKESEIGTIPRQWEAAPFRDFGSNERPYLKTGPFGSSLKQEHWVEQGIPVITIGALGEGDFICSELLHVSDATAKQLSAYRVRHGDIVFSRVADVGRSVVVQDQEEGWLMSSNLMWIALDQHRASPAFVQANIAANPIVRSQIRRFVNAGGREVANAKVLNSLVLPWPNILEQKRIAEHLAACGDRLSREETELAKLRLLKQGLADDLLTGRVRVISDTVASRRNDPSKGQLGLEL